MLIIVEFNNDTTQNTLMKVEKKIKLNYQLGWHEKIGRKVKSS